MFRPSGRLEGPVFALAGSGPIGRDDAVMVGGIRLEAFNDLFDLLRAIPKPFFFNRFWHEHFVMLGQAIGKAKYRPLASWVERPGDLSFRPAEYVSPGSGCRRRPPRSSFQRSTLLALG